MPELSESPFPSLLARLMDKQDHPDPIHLLLSLFGPLPLAATSQPATTRGYEHLHLHTCSMSPTFLLSISFSLHDTVATLLHHSCTVFLVY